MKSDLMNTACRDGEHVDCCGLSSCGPDVSCHCDCHGRQAHFDDASADVESLRFTKGPYEHGKVGPLSFEEMRSEYAKSIKATLDYFGGDVLAEVHGVYLKGSEVRVCITGISPNSPANADLFAAAPELYEALEAIVRIWSNHGTQSIEFSDAIERGANAIVKAEGPR